MATDSLPNSRGNFQELRNMWSSKAQAQPTSSSEPRQEQKKSPRNSIPTLKITNATSSISTIKNDSSRSSNNDRITIFESVKILPPIEEYSSSPMPPPPPTIIFQHQAQSIATIKQVVNNMSTEQTKDILLKNPKNTGIHRWHITKHVFRSGLIFNRTRRASDSIIPLLMNTHKFNHRARSDSLESTVSQTPFESLIDYINHNQDHDKDSLTAPIKMKRSTSDTSDCIRRNKLDDSIFQYEMVLRHLKNYEQFMTTYPTPISTSKSISSKQPEQSLDNEMNTTEAKFLAKSSIPNRQTQSLSRHVGRTFTEFIMNDLFSSSSSSSPSSKSQRCIISHASSQTDSSEPSQEITAETNHSNELIPPVELDRNNSVTTEEARVVLNELDTMLDNSIQQPPITPNSEINVVVVNPPVPPSEPQKLPTPKPLMQRLFEGKKTAYSPSDLNMENIRLPEEMMLTYETAKKKSFFDSEEMVYATKMIKISRRGYTQHVRLLCITTERVYNLTKRDPYPKEGLLFANILGVTCTPYKDGFICIHTKEAYDDRGDWLVVVDHPCEFITQLFMVLKRDNNNDRFLKIETKFTHCRRCYGESCSNDCSVEARLSDSFRIKKADFDAVIIFTT